MSGRPGSGSDAGAFTANITPPNRGPATTEIWEIWDNPSAGNTAGNTSCHVGFYAVGR